ncbi:hypothetical protein BGX30_008069 [Mortierella sp. GBA39]|nr:hypothetical protein BGX30_008069 [Mortierella sp. GBA39]
MTVSATSTANLQSESVRSLYDQFITHQKDHIHLKGIFGTLQEVMTPKKAAGTRARS